MNEEIRKQMEGICDWLNTLELDEKVVALNQLRAQLHEVSPFRDQPVDLVIWAKGEQVAPNHYNPNRVAPQEMVALGFSIRTDGLTMPIVTGRKEESSFVVADGEHRYRVATGDPVIRKRIAGYLPISVLNTEPGDTASLMASTIRHNNARGKHQVVSESEIVHYMLECQWTDDEIAQRLGKSYEELIRLKQVGKVATLLANQEYDKAWDF